MLFTSFENVCVFALAIAALGDERGEGIEGKRSGGGPEFIKRRGGECRWKRE